MERFWNRHQLSAKLWAFAGTLPEGQREHLIRARGVDTAGNVERVGPMVVVWVPVRTGCR